MNRRKWKKVTVIVTMMLVLVFAFWYGGDGEGLYGFSVSDSENTDKGISEKTTDFREDSLSNEGSGRGEQTGDSEGISSGQSDKTSGKKENVSEDGNIFQKIFMKIRQTSHSSNTVKKKTQNNKKAQANANKAAKKSRKKNKKTADKEQKETSDTEGHKTQDGLILTTTVVKIKEGSSVFDVLRDVTKANKIHLEYNFTPLYKSYYIEGIHNLYEQDCGELSGWMYSVNGKFPGISCSSYEVKEGDIINWVYTCNLGKDVGGYFEE